jgi:putative molybdopterin biosynthesis protein
MQTKNLSTPGFQAVAETIASEPFRRFLALQTGYDTTNTGNIRHI